MLCLERSGKDSIGGRRYGGGESHRLSLSYRIAGRITIVRRNRLRVFVGCHIGHLFV